MAMTVIDALGANADVEIVCSDIDTKVLATADKDIHDADSRGLSPDQLKRFFLRGSGANAGLMRIKPELRRLVEFRPFNLMAPRWLLGEPFDIVFCLNVMIYFDPPTQRRVLEQMRSVMRPSGLLMTTLGSCIAACLWDRNVIVGGLNHFMLPGGDGSGRYGSYAMEVLINQMMKLGAQRASMEAKIFGGGAVIGGMISSKVGERNTEFVMHYLKTERIPVVSKDVLDIYPRKVCFMPVSGKAMVKRLASGNTEALQAQDRAAAQRAAPETSGGSVDLF